MKTNLLRALLISGLTASSTFALSGTGGTPLGGMGTGYVKFDGQKFKVSGKMPPAAADHCKGQPESSVSASGFSFYVGGTAKMKAKAASEDAKCPLQTADFGKVGDVEFSLDAFGPYWPGEGKIKYQLATSPLAMFDITAKNSGSAAVDVAVAMEFANGGLLGGATSGKVDGKQGITFSGSTDNAYLMVDCNGATPTFSSGAAGTFESAGTLADSDGNLVAAKCSIPAGETVHFKFVLAWYRQYDTEGYYYHNFYQNSKEAAEFGMQYFDSVSTGITSFVDRTMASNFPDWYKDRLLNNTYPLVHNSVCAKDGRCAFWEGNYGIIGTIDQGQHAAVFYSYNWPSVQWHELQYWARSQRSSGQVHHDFNQGVQKFNPGSSGNNRHLLAWDNSDHPDYWWFPQTESWADLNCMFIFKAYELMIATGSVDSLKIYWPAIKKSAGRLATQCGGGKKIPETSHSTYDRCQSAGTGCSYTPEYNGGIAIAAFKAMVEMAKTLEDNETATTYADNAAGLQAAFKQKYENLSSFGVSASVANSGRFPEGHVAGYSWANYLCLEPVMDEGFIKKTIDKMRSTQKQATGDRKAGANGEWLFYCVDHYGGSEIAIGGADEALALHKLDYDYYYGSVPEQVHWQSLQESSGKTGHDSYMTAPTVWHSYFQFCGYQIDNANQRLWIRPRIPTSMNGEIKDAILLNPKGHGTLNYKETPDAAEAIQAMHVSFDNEIPVKELVLKDNIGIDAPFVYINGQLVDAANVKLEGTGFEKNIRVTLTPALSIGPEGDSIIVSKVPVGISTTSFGKLRTPTKLLTRALTAGKQFTFSSNTDGLATIEIFSLNGAKIGNLFSAHVSSGSTSFIWNGKTVDGHSIGNKAVLLRLVTPKGSAAQQTIILE